MPINLLSQYIIYIVILAAIVAILLAVVRHFGIAVPQIVYTIFWVVLGAALAILGIQFLVGLAR